MKRSALAGFALACVLAMFPVAATAEEFPSRQMTFVVPFPAGSATDGVARRLADSIRAATKVPVIVENKPGADGNLAAMSVLRAEPDGYTIFITTNSTHAANVSLFNSMPFDPKADFAPVAGLITIPMILTVKADFPAKTFAEFVTLAKERAPSLTFGTGNQTSRGAAELVKARQGLDMRHVPYRGAPQALTDLMGGQIDSFFADPISAGGLIRDGAVRVLAVTSAKRVPSLPDVPTLAESGLPGFELNAWVAAFAHAKVPPPIIAKINSHINAFLNDPANIAFLTTVGATPFPTTPQQLGAFAEADTKRWAEIVDIAKIEKK